jgi:hypothetical protein
MFKSFLNIFIENIGVWVNYGVVYFKYVDGVPLNSDSVVSFNSENFFMPNSIRSDGYFSFIKNFNLYKRVTELLPYSLELAKSFLKKIGFFTSSNSNIVSQLNEKRDTVNEFLTFLKQTTDICQENIPHIVHKYSKYKAQNPLVWEILHQKEYEFLDSLLHNEHILLNSTQIDNIAFKLFTKYGNIDPQMGAVLFTLVNVYSEQIIPNHLIDELGEVSDNGGTLYFLTDVQFKSLIKDYCLQSINYINSVNGVHYLQESASNFQHTVRVKEKID